MTADPEIQVLLREDTKYTEQEMNAAETLLVTTKLATLKLGVATRVRSHVERTSRTAIRTRFKLDDGLHGLHAWRSVAFDLGDGKNVGYLVI